MEWIQAECSARLAPANSVTIKKPRSAVQWSTSLMHGQSAACVELAMCRLYRRANHDAASYTTEGRSLNVGATLCTQYTAKASACILQQLVNMKAPSRTSTIRQQHTSRPSLAYTKESAQEIAIHPSIHKRDHRHPFPKLPPWSDSSLILTAASVMCIIISARPTAQSALLPRSSPLLVADHTNASSTSHKASWYPTI